MTAGIEPSCSQYAYLYLVRDAGPELPPYSPSDLEDMAFDPAEVTRLTGLTPTTAYRRGDPAPGRRPPHRFSAWHYGHPEVPTFETEEVVTPLLDAIEPYAAGIATACHSLGMRAGIMVVIWTELARDDDGGTIATAPAISYRPDTIQRLARLHLGIDHDQYLVDIDETQ